MSVKVMGSANENTPQKLLLAEFNVNSGTIIRFQNNNEVNTDDGKIGTALFASGLNIVGSQTGSGLGRQIRLFGDLLTNNIKYC